MNTLWILILVIGGTPYAHSAYIDKQGCMNVGMEAHGYLQEKRPRIEVICKEEGTGKADYISRRLWAENEAHNKKVERQKNIKFTEEMWQKRRKELKEKLYMCLDTQQFGKPTPQCAHRLNNQISEESAYYAKRIKEDASKP